MNEDVKLEVTAKQMEWSTPQKNCVITLHNDAGWSNYAIVKDMRIAQFTVQDLLKFINNPKNSKNCSRAPKKLIISQVDQLVELITQHEWKGCIYTWKRLAKDSGFDVSIFNHIIV